MVPFLLACPNEQLGDERARSLSAKRKMLACSLDGGVARVVSGDVEIA